MSETRIQELQQEIERYTQSILIAQEGLEAAEQELEDALDQARR